MTRNSPIPDLALHDERYIGALRMLWERSAYDRGFISNPFAGDSDAAIGLRRTSAVLEQLGRPQDRLKILHVAGSKGKGSTCAFAASMLTKSGLRTGLYTSPHLHSFRERMAIDGEPISETAFADTCDRGFAAMHAAEAASPELGEITTFELTTAMALDHFANSGCDTAVIEVGLGGTLDATNVVDPVASLIGTLDYEHTRVLGSTIAEIAANKAGIIKPGKPVATSALVADAYDVVAQLVAEQKSPWLLAGRDWFWRGSWRSFEAIGPWGTIGDLATGLVGAHQVDNACLALAGVWLMLGEQMNVAAVREGMRKTSWPGRFEVIQTKDRTIVLDGAHTPAAAAALATAVVAEFPERRCAVILGVLRDKDPVAIARALTPIAERFIAVAPPGPRGLPSDELFAQLSNAEIQNVSASAIAESIMSAADLTLVTGSLATVAAARELLGLAIPDPTFAP